MRSGRSPGKGGWPATLGVYVAYAAAQGVEMRHRLIVSRDHDESGRAVLMGAALFADFMERARALHARGEPVRGLFLSPADERGRERPPVEASFGEGHDPFEAAALAGLAMRARRSRRVLVAPFHAQTTAPARFSMIDYVPHTPPFRWHLVVSLRDPQRPVVQPFLLHKTDEELVAAPVLLLVEGVEKELVRVERLMSGGRPRAAAGASAGRS
jgi:hypothetical protein